MKRTNVMKILIPLIALLLCGVVVLMERYGVTSKYLVAEQTEQEQLIFSANVQEEAVCLILTNQQDNVSAIYEEMITDVLDEMRVSYDLLEVPEDFGMDVLNEYESLVITFEDWTVLGENLLTICNWVKAGGNMMNMSTPIPNASFLTMVNKIGIASGGDEYVAISGIQVMNNSMIGGEEGVVYAYESEEALEISLNVYLSDACEVLLTSEDAKVPLLWKYQYGEGAFVIFNEVITDKYQRGFVSLAYSSLGDVCIYPVINGSAFYLDDFPSPVPEGNGEYIKKDYGVNIASFYSSIWWPKVLTWGEDYGIRYTGLIIEKYSDDVEAPFERTREETQFTTFGNMLLNAGGELGFHGYNHMPLCIEGVDDTSKYEEYNLWASDADIKAGLTELQEFSENLFPESTFSVYVPPSNILSEAGMEALLEACPDINVIAGIYLPDAEASAFEQEFEVDENGVIHTPRVVSGLELTDYQKIAALAELNLHYVQSHFMHPDDLLDEDRGAAIGFEALSKSFEAYLEWVYTAAPNIRNVTGSEMGTAVMQYDKLTMNRKLEGKVLTVQLGGFSGEAHFLMRVNEGEFVSAEGCTCENITGDIYAVHATQDEIKIYLGE